MTQNMGGLVAAQRDLAFECARTSRRLAYFRALLKLEEALAQVP